MLPKMTRILNEKKFIKNNKNELTAAHMATAKTIVNTFIFFNMILKCRFVQINID